MAFINLSRSKFGLVSHPALVCSIAYVHVYMFPTMLVYPNPLAGRSNLYLYSNKCFFFSHIRQPLLPIPYFDVSCRNCLICHKLCHLPPQTGLSVLLHLPFGSQVMELGPDCSDKPLVQTNLITDPTSNNGAEGILIILPNLGGSTG